MSSRIHYWQWPNLLALDAAFIAVAWQLALADALGQRVGAIACLVLGLSVWLTYVADRLFDVARRAPEQLLSLRHAFAKRHARKLWWLWGIVLLSNLVLALGTLRVEQLLSGAVLLVLCLIYTALNQTLSRRFFPKELCVALIYTGGVIVFLPSALPVGFSLFFALLCLLNCLVIGGKEQAVDAQMQVHSLVPMVAAPWLGRMALFCHLLVLIIAPSCALALSFSFLGLGLLQLFRRQFSVERFRVLSDGLLLLAPCLWLML